MTDAILTALIFAPSIFALGVLFRSICGKYTQSSCATLFVFGFILSRTMVLRINSITDGVPLLKEAQNSWLLDLLTSSLVFNLSYLLLFACLTWLAWDSVRWNRSGGDSSRAK